MRFARRVVEFLLAIQLRAKRVFLDAHPLSRESLCCYFTLLDGGDNDDGVSRARSAARAYRGWSSISVVGCAPPNTRRAVRLGGTAPGARLSGLALGIRASGLYR